MNKMPDRTSDALRTLGFLDEAEAALFDERRARAPEETWSETLHSIGLDDATLRGALNAIEIRPATSGLAQVDVTPETDGRYEKVTDLGIGGMGRVDLIDDRHLHRSVARKALLIQHPATEMRFLREARITAQLEHPGVVPIYELGKNADGTLYYTMKRIRGDTLREALLATETLEERLGLLGVFVDLCNAVGYAHAKSVVHRDLKPDNVMIGPFGETLVLDWGLAKVAGEEEFPLDTAAATAVLIRSGDDSNLTRAGTVLGTPRYMSPEQASGRLAAVDARSDVWSLGAMLFEILTGNPTFSGNTAVVLAQVREGVITPVLDEEQRVPPELAAIAQKCLAKDPDDRYETAEAIATEIEAWRNGTVVSAHDYTALERIQRVAGQYRVALVGVGAMFMALVVSAGLFIPGLVRQRDLAEQGQAEATLQANRSLFRATLYDALEREQDGDAGSALALVRLAASLPALSEAEARTADIALTRLTDHGADLLVLTDKTVTITAQAWLPNSTLIAWSTADQVTFSDPQNGTVRGTLPSPGGPISALAFPPDGGSILVATKSGKIASFTFPTGAQSQEWQIDAPIRSLSVSPNGEQVAADVNGVTVLSLRDGNVLVEIPDAHNAFWMAGGDQLVVTRGTQVEVYGTVWYDLQYAMNHPAGGLRLAIAEVSGSVATASLLDTSLVRRIVAVQERLDDDGVGWTSEGPPAPPGATKAPYLALRNVLRLQLGDDDAKNAEILTRIGRQRVARVDEAAEATARADPRIAAEMLWVSSEAHFHFASLGLRLGGPTHLLADGEVSAYHELLRERVRPNFTPIRRLATERAVEALEIAIAEGISADWVRRARSRLELVHPRAVAVTGAQDDRVRVWALLPGLLRNEWPAHNGDVHDVGVAPDLSRVASGGSDGEARVWDLYLGDPLLTISTGERDPTRVRFLSNGDRLLTRSTRGSSAQMWEIARARTSDNIRENQVHKPFRTLSPGSGRIESVAEDSKGRFLAVATRRGGTRLWPLDDPLQPSIRIGPNPHLIGLGAEVIVDGDALLVHDAVTLRPTSDIGAILDPPRGEARVAQAASSSDRAVIAFDDGRMGIHERGQPWTWVVSEPSDDRVAHLALSPTQNKRFVAILSSHKVLLGHGSTVEELDLASHPIGGWSPSGNHLAVALETGGVALLDGAAPGPEVATDFQASAIHWLDEDRMLLGHGTRVVEWDLEADVESRVWLTRNSDILRLLVSPDRATVAVLTREDLTTLDAQTGALLATQPLRDADGAPVMAWTHGGLLLSEEGDDELYILDPRSGERVRTFSTSSRIVTAVQAGPQILLGSTDGLIHRLHGTRASIQTNLRACRNGKVVPVLPFPPLDSVREPERCTD